MNANKYIERKIRYSIIFIVIGVLAGLIGFVLEFEKQIMIGLTCGFLPTGIGMLLIYTLAKNKENMIKNIEFENEERNVFINSKAGHTGFWVSYWYIFVAFLFSNVVNLSLQKFLI